MNSTFTCPHDCAIPAIRLVSRTVWLEIRRREEYAALLILMGVYLLFALAAQAGGLRSPQASSFLLNMGLVASATLAAILTILSAARVLPSELERRTIYPLLAKPIERRDLLLGKFLACTGAGMTSLLCFAAASWLLTSRLPEQQTLVAVQALVLQSLALCVLAALALCVSLFVPPAVTILLSGVVYFAGGPVAAALRSMVADSIAQPIGWLAGYLPDFTRFSLFTRYTDGGPPLPWHEFGAAFIYGLVLTLFFLMVAAYRFERRAL